MTIPGWRPPRPAPGQCGAAVWLRPVENDGVVEDNDVEDDGGRADAGRIGKVSQEEG